MRRAAAFAISIGCGLAVALFYHSIYESAVAREDDPWNVPAGFAGPRVLNAGRIHVEIDHPAGIRPHLAALSTLESRIENLTGQPVEIETNVEDVPASGTIPLTKIVDEERDHRDTPQFAGGSAGIYILYVGGEYADGASVLGAAYSGYSVVVFRSVIEDAGTPRPNGECAGIIGPTPCEIERAVLVHEVGHLLGLVNINYASAEDHWDETHGHHCSTTSCVMFWQIELGGPLAGPPPDDFDPACRADIAKIRGMWTGEPSRYWGDQRYVMAMGLVIGAFCGIGAVLAWLVGPGKKRTEPSGNTPPVPPPLPSDPAIRR